MNGIDVAIGRRLRLLRGMHGMSTEHVAARIGVTRRQVQQYEAGSDRLSAGLLFELAQIFDVPVGTFFDAVRLAEGERSRGRTPHDRRGVQLARDFDTLPEVQKRAVLSLVHSLSFMECSWNEPQASRQRDGS